MLSKGTGTTPCSPIPCAYGDRARLSCALLTDGGIIDPAVPLGAGVKRLLQTLRQARPATDRQFLALADQHRRWELNELAQRLYQLPEAVELPTSASSDTGLSPDSRRILAAVDRLPEGECEASDLVRIDGNGPPTVGRGLQRFAFTLGDLYPGEETPGTSIAN